MSDITSKDVKREDRNREDRQTCEECKLKEAIYQCPRCNIRTCSLECVRKHKARTDCNGKRNRAEFLPLCRMSDSTLKSDYFFLEEVLDRMPRDSKRAKTQHQTSRKDRRLLQQCEKQNIHLKMMPTMMERHKKNNSWFCVKRDAIIWKVEVIVHPSKKSFSFQLADNEADILTRVQKHAEKEGLIMIDDSMRLFVKKLPAPTNKQRYVEIHPIDNLKSILAGMTVIEHPTIYCVDKDCIADFPTEGNEKIKELPGGTIIDASIKGVKMEASNDSNERYEVVRQESHGESKAMVKPEGSDLMTEVSTIRHKAMEEDM